MLKLTPTATKLIQSAYLVKDSFGRTMERPDDMLRRVAHAIAQVEGQWGSIDEIEYYESEFIKMMRNLEFLPAPTILLNAGTPKGQLISGVVLPVPDSVEGITQAASQMAILQKNGAHTGFSFSRIRPSRDMVETAGGQASGPVNFMRLFDTATDVLKQGSRLQPLNMAVLHVSHPDIFDFIKAKEGKALPNFRTAIGITSHFMRCLKKGTTYPLVNPRSGQVMEFIRASEIFDALCKSASVAANPGLIFLDEINRHNPTPQIGNIEACTPLGDMPLMPYEASCFGVINMAGLVTEKGFDEERFEILIDLAVRFLDNVLEANFFALPQCEKITLANRKLSLGLMGFADLLMRLGIPYDSPKAKTFATTTLKFMLKRARQASVALAKQRGPFANFAGSMLEKLKFKPMRNAAISAMGPSDILAHIANVASSIGPMKDLLDTESALVLPLQEFLRDNKLNDPALVDKIIKQKGDLKNITQIAKKDKDLFKVESEISLEHQLKMHSIFQKYTDNGIARIVELSKPCSAKDIYRLYMMAYQGKCKNINIDIK